MPLSALTAFPADAQGVSRWQPIIDEASQRFGIPVVWIERVIRAESGGRTHLHGSLIVSHAGAMGLMQLMPGTWDEMRRAHGLGDDPHDPRDNILAGTAYLRMMYDRFGYPGMFAGYNAGPARYASHLATGRSLPAETRAYLATVAGITTPPANRSTDDDQPSLFVVSRPMPMTAASDMKGRPEAIAGRPDIITPTSPAPDPRLFVPRTPR